MLIGAVADLVYQVVIRRIQSLLYLLRGIIHREPDDIALTRPPGEISVQPPAFQLVGWARTTYSDLKLFDGFAMAALIA